MALVMICVQARDCEVLRVLLLKAPNAKERYPDGAGGAGISKDGGGNGKAG